MPDLTAAAAASAAAGTASAVLGAWLGLDVQSMAFSMAGAALGLTFVPDRMGTVKAALAFVGFSLAGAVAGTLAAHAWFSGPAAGVGRNLLALLIAAAGHPLLVALLSKAGPAVGAAYDKFFGAKP
jgi:hypothetical protein